MKVISCLLVLFFLFSCQQEIKQRTAPKDLISETEMVAIVKDLVLIEGHIAITYKQIQSYHQILTASSSEVFKSHSVSKRRYKRSFEYYASDQKKLTKIYSDVLNDLNEEKGKLNTTQAK